jgi:hypothetical protein
MARPAAATASCSSVDGDYTYHGSARPLVSSGVTDHDKPGYMSRDCTAFVDSDGKAYFLSSTNENYDLNLYRLTSDYLAIDSLAATLFKGGHREAPALWKRNSVYFGSLIHQYGDNGGDNQKWRVVDNGGGVVQLLGKGSKKLVAATSDGSSVALGSTSGGDSQLWEMAAAN